MALRIRRSRLPELLNKNGKSQVDLAVYLEVSEAHVSQVINLKRNFSVTKLKMTADLLKCNIDDLFEWEYY